MLGVFSQSALLVSLNGYSIKPSGPFIADFCLLSAGRFSFTFEPIFPPGTSRAPTNVSNIVRAQQQLYPPQPLLTVLPNNIATGLKGISSPSTSMVCPTHALVINSSATVRILSAGTSLCSCAHSGVYSFIWSINF